MIDVEAAETVVDQGADGVEGGEAVGAAEHAASSTKDPALDAFTPSAAFSSETTEVVVDTTFFGDDDPAPAPAGTIWYRVGA